MSGIFNASIFNNAIFNTGPSVPPGTVNYQGDGKTRKRKKRRNETQELFDDLEKSLRELVYGRGPVLEAPVVALEGEAASSIGLRPSVDGALRSLTETAQGYQDLSARVAAIRKEIAQYEAKKWQELIDDDDEFMLMN